MSAVRELSRAADAHYTSEVAADNAEARYQGGLDREFLLEDGSVEVRKALARVACSDLHDAAIIARAAHNRVRLKARHIEAELIALQALLKSIQLEGA